MAEKIRRNHVLKSLDIKESPSGAQVSFSIVFIKKDGERVFVPRAVSVGLPYSLSAHRFRGVLPVNIAGDKTGHVYPVCIDNILEYNGLEVTL
jgi:hypothetical protein